MTTTRKILIGVGALVIMLIIIGVSMSQSNKNVSTVQTSKVQRMDLASVVSASGEIKPKTYVNIDANAFGRIIKLYVKEGDKVKKGQLLAQLESVQSAADVNAAQAGLQASQSDAIAAEAATNTSVASLNRAKSDAEKAQLDWERSQGLYKAGLIPKSDYDTQKAAWQTAQAGLAQAEATLAQAKAQRESAGRHITQNEADLARFADVLQKTRYVAPFDGVVTSLPVREGETVVIGIQNSPGSTLMSIADMSIITAEVEMDETDIVDLKLGQPAEVSIDAIPNKTFKAVVSEIGDNAIVRSTGVATSQQTTASDEAKEFKVVVTLTNPPENLRPGLSATAKVTTAMRSNALSIPIQAVTVRKPSELQPVNSKGSVEAAAPAEPSAKSNAKNEIQGVFVVRNRKVEFVPVQTGISGTNDTEVLSGVKEGDEIVIGPYKVLRTLHPGNTIKVDNSTPVVAAE
jgi:HlyD family secretion protein